MKREPLKRIVWRRVHPDGTTPAKLSRTALRPHEEENVRDAVRLLRGRLRTWKAVSAAMTVPAKTMERVMNGERRVQDKWAVLVARALRVTLDDVICGQLPRVECAQGREGPRDLSVTSLCDVGHVPDLTGESIISVANISDLSSVPSQLGVGSELRFEAPMTTHTDLEKAKAKSLIKREFSARLAALPVSSQKDLLMDLLVDLEHAESEVETPPRAATTPHRPLRPAPSPKKTKSANGRALKGVPPGNGRRAEAETSFRAKVLEELRKSPELPVKELARRVYGDDGEKAVWRARAALRDLRKEGSVKNTGFGKWAAKE